MSPIPLIETEDAYKQALGSGSTVAALFSAEWAEQCSQILTIMEQLVKDSSYQSLKFLNVAIEEIPTVAKELEIEAVPTVIFFKDKKAVHRIDGINIAAFSATAKKLAGVAEQAQGSLDDRLRALIKKSKVMIFMKGDRNTPRCGFSKTLIQIMNETGVAYETFDILSDEDVRQGLKTFSDWPTYPQVYVNGELQGGLDIVKEMVTSGELSNVLKG